MRLHVIAHRSFNFMEEHGSSGEKNAWKMKNLQKLNKMIQNDCMCINFEEP